MFLLYGRHEINRGGGRKIFRGLDDSDMKCSQQCIQAFNKASRVMGMIKRTIRFKEVRIMISIKH